VTRAEEILARREVIGWRLGLERMRRLCSLLGMPQHRFASVHVVGTNGKTSVALMTAALVQAHGVRAGAYLSPHITSWRDRIVIGGQPIGTDAFEAAIERTEEAARAADRAAGEEGPVTQFELITAAAFWAFAEARVQVAAVEAGLGGRLDATNVIPSKATVLTSVGLDHTEWLGDTLEEIAGEKVAVLRDHTTLISGAVPAEVEPVIEREVDRKHASSVGVATAAVADRVPEGSGAAGDADAHSYQDANFGLAVATANTMLGRFDAQKLEGMREALSIPGRAELVEDDPDVIYDAAHNPDGARALAATLPELAGDEAVVCCLAVLAEKDADGMIAALEGAVRSFVCTEIPEDAIRGSGRPAGTSHPAAHLARLCRQAGADAEAIADPLAAWERARELARARDGVALAAGSHYLLSCIWIERHAASS
jgi:dihydrofolate synthase / folylpolyglutamate synthase